MKWKQVAPGVYVAPAEGPVQYASVRFAPSNTWTAYQTTTRQPKTLGLFDTDRLARQCCETDAKRIVPPGPKD